MAASLMENIFIGILNQSISASWLILAVIVIRVCMKKTPKSLRYVLWALVAVRLLYPIFIESAWSLVPEIEVFTKEDTVDGYFDSIVLKDNENLDVSVQQELFNQIDEYDQHIEVPNQNQPDRVVEILPEETVDITDRPTNKGSLSIQEILPIASWIWGIGMVGICFSSAVSAIRLKRKVGASLQIEKQVWMCDDIQSPFILGMISPRIYVPSFVTEEQLSCILAHENEHLKYRDHWWKPFGFMILTLHWFNPLVWISYILLCRDIELACDERVIQHMNEEEKKLYSKSLLLCNNPRYLISACPVAFGEIGVKARIKSILDYKKPSTWVVGIGVLVCIFIAVCFMTNPKNADGEGLVDTESTEDTMEKLPIDLSVITAEEITEEEALQATNDELGEVFTSMLDGQSGYVLRCTSPACGLMNKVLCKTSDGGTSFEKYMDISDMPNYPCDIYFFTEDIGYIVTDYHSSDTFLYRTEDGGKTWSPQAIYIPGSWYRYVNGLCIEDGILHIEVVLDEEAFYYAYTTDDMGDTWQIIYSEREDIINYNGRIYKKAELCDATLQWLELSEQERMLSSYFPPEFMVFAQKWGITLTATDITPTSLTLKCTQSGGRPTGDLQTGSWYVLETWTQKYGWKQVDYLSYENEIMWTQEAWTISMNDTCEWKVNWEWLYGQLPDGKYRIGKEIMDFRGPGDFDKTIYYAEFEIAE